MGKKNYPVKNYVITSAQACASPHTHFLEGIDQLAEDLDAEVIVLPMIGKNAKEDLDQINPAISEQYNVESGEPKLNDNLQVKQFHIRPYQIDPLTGLSRFVQKSTTTVFASPKQRLKPVPHSNQKIAKFMATTGACTRPNYATGSDVSAERRRLGDIARRDHIYGALIVEVEDNEIFHMRNVRADTRGKFVDLGYKYDGSETTGATLEALVLGDWHNGKTDEAVKEANYKIIKDLKPRRLILHDFFDGHSVSHHIDKQFIQQKILQQYDIDHGMLEWELEEAYTELMKINDAMEGRKIVIVPSNHNEFLNRYLDEGRFMREPHNARFGLKLAHYMAEQDYNNPLVAGLKMFGKVPRNIVFPARDEDFKVRGYQLGAHGDKGPNGGRGSMKSKEEDWGKSITGHVHQAQIMRDTYTVGTSLDLNMFYMRGYPSAWSHSHALLWDTGTVQMIHLMGDNKRYRAHE